MGGSGSEENVYMAKLAEQVKRYEEMVEFMEKVVSTSSEGEEMTVEERNLLSVAYKNVIGARRASWRIVSSIEQKEEGRGNKDHVSVIRLYKSKIEEELFKICDGILNLLETKLVISAISAGSKEFYLKMKGDYHRYLAEMEMGIGYDGVFGFEMEMEIGYDGVFGFEMEMEIGYDGVVESGRVECGRQRIEKKMDGKLDGTGCGH